MRVNRYDPYTTSTADIFDLKPSGKLYLGTSLGSSTLNIAGSLEVLGSRRFSVTSSGIMGWSASSPSPSFQNFTLRYLGDGTNPAQDLMTLKPDGGINVNGFLAPDVNLAIRDNAFGTFTPETKVHIKTWAPTNGGEPTEGVYGLIVENTGWRAHDFAFEVRSKWHGPVFSVGNAGHVLIGIQGDGSPEAQVDITKNMADSHLYNLYVAKGIRTERIKVDVAANNGWADYVFEEDYELMPTLELEAYIKEHKHLPGVPSAAEVAEEGIDLAEINKILLEKIEELTLRVIELEKAQQ